MKLAIVSAVVSKLIRFLGSQSSECKLVNNCYLNWHVHPHEKDHRDEVHSHDLRQEQDDEVGALRTRNPDEELGHCQ